MIRQIIITGAGGFLGSMFSEFFSNRGYFVIAIDRGMFTHDQLSEADLVVDKLNPEEIKTLFKTL